MSSFTLPCPARAVRAHFYPRRQPDRAQLRVDLIVSAPDAIERFDRIEAVRVCRELLELAEQYLASALGRCEHCGCDEYRCSCPLPCKTCAHAMELLRAPAQRSPLELSVSEVHALELALASLGHGK